MSRPESDAATLRIAVVLPTPGRPRMRPMRAIAPPGPVTDRRACRPCRSASSVHELPQPLPDLEERHLLAGDAHARPGLRVPADAGAPLANLEAAEAADLDLVAPPEGVRDGLEDRVHDGLAVLLRQIGRLGELVDQIRPRHDRESPGMIISALLGSTRARATLALRAQSEHAEKAGAPLDKPPHARQRRPSRSPPEVGLVQRPARQESRTV